MLLCGVVSLGVAEQAAAPASATDVRPQDNRGFTDTNTAQKLTEGDIAQMKNDGKGGQAIIQVCRCVFSICCPYPHVIQVCVFFWLVFLPNPQACFFRVQRHVQEYIVYIRHSSFCSHVQQ